MSAQLDTIIRGVYIFIYSCSHTWAYGKEKIRGAFRSVYHFRGQKKFFGTINCQYCQTFKRILHDYLYFNNKLRAFGLFAFLFSHFLPDLCSIFARLFNLFGGQLPPPAPPARTPMFTYRKNNRF
jgi:hypothetical protein